MHNLCGLKGILKSDWSGINEFSQMPDGKSWYPGLRIWATTNNIFWHGMLIDGLRSLIESGCPWFQMAREVTIPIWHATSENAFQNELIQKKKKHFLINTKHPESSQEVTFAAYESRAIPQVIQYLPLQSTQNWLCSCQLPNPAGG